MSLQVLVVVLAVVSTSNGFYTHTTPHPFLEQIINIGNSYMNRIAETVMATAKNALSNAAGATAHVASKMADHTYNALRWKRNTERGLGYTLRSVRSMSADYANVERRLNWNMKSIFSDSLNRVRRGVQQANMDVVGQFLRMAAQSNPVVRHLTDNCLSQVLSLGDVFVNGFQDCVHEAELTAETNVNRFAKAVSQVPSNIREDFSTIDNCNTPGSLAGNGLDIADPYVNCAGGTVGNMISRVKKDAMNVGLHVPTAAFGFAHIGSKVSMCVTNKFHEAKRRFENLAMEVAKVFNHDQYYNNIHTNTIFRR